MDDAIEGGIKTLDPASGKGPGRPEPHTALTSALQTLLYITSRFPVGKLMKIPGVFRVFFVLFPLFPGVEGKKVQPGSQRALLYQTSHGHFQVSREAVSDGGVPEIGGPGYTEAKGYSKIFFLAPAGQ